MGKCKNIPKVKECKSHSYYQDQIPEHGDIPDMYDRETSHAETPGQMSYRSESGVPEDININLINSGNLHSQIPMQHIHDPQLADPTVNRTGMMSYVVDDTGQHVIDSGSWDVNTMSQGQGQISQNQLNTGGERGGGEEEEEEEEEEEDRPKKLASMMSHMYY